MKTVLQKIKNALTNDIKPLSVHFMKDKPQFYKDTIEAYNAAHEIYEKEFEETLKEWEATIRKDILHDASNHKRFHKVIWKNTEDEMTRLYLKLFKVFTDEGFTCKLEEENHNQRYKTYDYALIIMW